MAEDALEHSRETRHLLNNHIQVTQIQLENLEKNGEGRHQAVVDTVSKLESALKWAGGLIVTLLLSVLGWALLQQVSANDAQKKDLQQQLDLQAQQLEYMRTQASLRASAAEAANTTHSGR